ncbi:MAG: HI0074 family nucleotidyltransferase substrate-binding subunit [Eubacteriales bacterium]
MSDVLQQIKKIAIEHREVKKVVLFGSRARGTHSPTSDYDIAFFITPNSSPSTLLLHEIEEIHCLHKIDVVLISPETSADLLENIQKEGVILMERRTKLENYTKAVARLQEAVALCEENPCPFYFDALIQRFEFSTELAWKTCKEYLQNEGVSEVNSPKSVMKEAFSVGLLSETDIWLSILTDRNRTSHIYDEATSKEIAEQVMTVYLATFEALLEKLTKETW